MSMDDICVMQNVLVGHTDSPHESMAKLMSALQRTMKHVIDLSQNLHIESASSLRDMAVLLRSSGQDVLNLALSAASIMDEKSNLDTSLGRLPNEIIAEILLSYVTSINDPYIGNLSDWTHLMHVCSRWYSIIRNDPRFWRCIDLSWSESTIKRHLSLSGDCLLRLELTLYDKSAHELYNLPLPDLGITGELLIRTGSDKNHLWIRENDPVTHAAARCAEAILRCEAPHLSRLSVQYDYASCVEKMEDLPFPSIRHLSSLEFLQLRGYIVIDRWSQTFPTSLRDIHIGKSSYARNAKHTISLSGARLWTACQ
ncbi:hypothetical protein SISSUDRAFT_132734 [Sistotremastrum suecicum HHB10207 ss-3]|uniref:F-box domain-containing protein n=1 Tax=Sistotremastrum suecicum HHB10207 ss-3 TaxID=1314776 RepID=A0A166AVU8_9AGAM|nr:hypothetical protein SISSUDRAFT_132734 [Sistotremastrum suecicum HHB10207 ss-3]